MKQQGLSLLELLITLFILILMLTVVAPPLTELLHKHRAISYMQQFSRHLHYARIQATSSQLPVRVCPLSQGECEGSWQHDPIQLALINPITTELTLLRELPKPPRHHQLRYNRQQLQFRRDGSLDVLENGTFYYCPPAPYQWHIRLVINQAGRNRLSEHQQPCPG